MKHFPEYLKTLFSSKKQEKMVVIQKIDHRRKGERNLFFSLKIIPFFVLAVIIMLLVFDNNILNKNEEIISGKTNEQINEKITEGISGNIISNIELSENNYRSDDPIRGKLNILFNSSDFLPWNTTVSLKFLGSCPAYYTCEDGSVIPWVDENCTTIDPEPWAICDGSMKIYNCAGSSGYGKKCCSSSGVDGKNYYNLWCPNTPGYEPILGLGFCGDSCTDDVKITNTLLYFVSKSTTPLKGNFTNGTYRNNGNTLIFNSQGEGFGSCNNGNNGMGGSGYAILYLTGRWIFPQNYLCIKTGNMCINNTGIYIDFCGTDNNYPPRVVQPYACSGSSCVLSYPYSCLFGYICVNGTCVPQNPTCTDSDGGINKSIKGTCNPGGIFPVLYTDYCLLSPETGMPFVNEYYCDNTDKCSLTLLSCEQGCTDGACLSQNPTCTDSDGGINKSVKGICTSGGNSHTDYCLLNSSTHSVNEFYCDTTSDTNDKCVSTQLPCEQGCTDGACISSQQTCTDSDGGINKSIKGTCNPGGIFPVLYTDYCLLSPETGMPFVNEYYCDNTDKCSLTLLSCESNCISGACVQIPFCNKIGKVCMNNTGNYTDQCNGNELQPYYCSDYKCILSNFSYSCPPETYCSYGECINVENSSCSGWNNIYEIPLNNLNLDLPSRGGTYSLVLEFNWNNSVFYYTDSDIFIFPRHKECIDDVCKYVDGEGEDECNSNSACYSNCQTNWFCTNFGSCVSGWQSRTCTDLNGCGIITGKPVEQQTCSCVSSWSCSWQPCISGNMQNKVCSDIMNCNPSNISYISESRNCCIDEWDCGKWSSCSNGLQTRTCSETTGCGTSFNKPNEQKNCSSTGNFPWWIIIVIALVIIIGVLVLILFLKKKTPGNRFAGGYNPESYESNYPSNPSDSLGYTRPFEPREQQRPIERQQPTRQFEPRQPTRQFSRPVRQTRQENYPQQLSQSDSDYGSDLSSKRYVKKSGPKSRKVSKRKEESSDEDIPLPSD